MMLSASASHAAKCLIYYGLMLLYAGVELYYRRLAYAPINISIAEVLACLAETSYSFGRATNSLNRDTQQ